MNYMKFHKPTGDEARVSQILYVFLASLRFDGQHELFRLSHLEFSTGIQGQGSSF